MGCFKPTSYHSDHAVAKCKAVGDTTEMKHFIRFLFAVLILPMFLLLSGSFWQELLCEVAMDNSSDVYQMEYNECRAINNPSIRSEFMNS